MNTIMSNTGIPTGGEGGIIPQHEMLFALEKGLRNTVIYTELPIPERDLVVIPDIATRQFNLIGFLEINEPLPHRSDQFFSLAFNLYRKLDQRKKLPRLPLEQRMSPIHSRIVNIATFGLSPRVKNAEGKLILPVRGKTDGLLPVVGIIVPDFLINSEVEGYQDDPLEDAREGVLQNALNIFIKELQLSKQFQNIPYRPKD